MPAMRLKALRSFCDDPHFARASVVAFSKLPVELPITNAPIGILTLKNRTLSHAAQLFVNCAREVAKPLAQRKG